jgi:hypothetical protein
MRVVRVPISTRVPIVIENLINNIAEKLPKRITGYEQRPALCLWNITVVQTVHPIVEDKDHVRKMKLAWLAHGKVGLMNYVEPYLKPSSLEKVRRLILSIA